MCKLRLVQMTLSKPVWKLVGGAVAAGAGGGAGGVWVTPVEQASQGNVVTAGVQASGSSTNQDIQHLDNTNVVGTGDAGTLAAF